MKSFIEFLSESINDKGILKAIFMSGNPGCGKSYVISTLRAGNIEAKIVNTDTMLEYFNFNKNVYADIDRVKLLTKNQLSLFLNSILPLFIDSTSTNPNALVRRKGLIESLGYSTGIIIVKTSLETSLKRNNQRDRKVPENLLREKYNEFQELIPFYKGKFDWHMEIDNDNGELTEDVILRAYKKTIQFFNQPIDNPMGEKLISKMKENKWKYLSPNIYSMDYIKKLCSMWYKAM